MVRKKVLPFAFFFILLSLQGCGANSTGQTIHEPDTDIVSSVAPSPPVSMQPEQIDLEFSHSTGSVQNVSVQLSMPDMAMGDKVQLTEKTPGKYQGNYRFSMTGKWTETITYTINGKSETTKMAWEVKE